MTKSKPYMEKLSNVCKEKNYNKEFFSIITIICCSEQMHDAGYTSEQALENAIELVIEKEKSQVYSELLKMTGYYPEEEW